MKLPNLGRILAASFLMTGFGNVSAAQEAVQEAAHKPRPNHTRYKFIDLGTFGGPVGYESVDGEGNQILNNSGAVAFSADTATPDPNAPDFCFNFHPDGCFVTHAARWTRGILTDLGALPGVNGSAVGAINALGWSVGQSQNGAFDPLIGVPETRAVFWNGDKIHDLGTLGGDESLATGITNDGMVVGMSTVDNNPEPFASVLGPWQSATHPFIWSHGKMFDLGTLGGPDAFVGVGCVNQGLLVGGSFTSSVADPDTGLPPLHPFAFENGKLRDLGTFGGNFGFAQCGNNRGQVIGQSSLPGDSAFHPFLWNHGVLRDLGTLGGDNGTPIWLNDAGDVVGEADLPGNQTSHAFLWRDGAMRDLGTLGDSSHASAINSRGQIVGYFVFSGRTEPPFRHPFLWEESGPMVDLNTLIPANSGLELVTADNINERGEIVGVGVPGRCFVDFCGHLLLLIPCAESDLQGCEDNGEDASSANENDHLSATVSTTIRQHPMTAKERVAAWREHTAKRYRRPLIEAPLP
jgi:probable HAF family extracellular repeat protein